MYIFQTFSQDLLCFFPSQFYYVTLYNKTRHYKIQMQYTNSAKCDVKKASLVQLLSWQLFDSSISAPAFSSTNIQHRLSTSCQWKDLILLDFFYIYRICTRSSNVKTLQDQFLYIVTLTQHEWSQEYMSGFQGQGWKTLAMILETKWTQFLCQGQYKKNKRNEQKVRKCYTRLKVNTAVHDYTMYITGDGRA